MSANYATTDAGATMPPAGAPPTLSPTDAVSIPDHVSIPGYEMLAELGRGGMGVVYRARQIGLNRDVALKMILSGGHASATDLARFKAEAEAVARLQHPNVVQVYEVGESDGLPYFSLEYCSGGSLEKLLAGVPQPPRGAAALIETLARAIHAAHQSGMIHRDLKPANVLLTVNGTPKVTDFGLAKQLDSGSGRTASGAILGTPSYMAPEQANGSKEIGPAADIYALGAILYELLIGRPPFRAATPLDTVLQVIGSEPVPPTRLNPQVPRDLETIALKCLQKEPTKRYASAAALADDLHRWQIGEPITARPAGAFEKATKWAKRRPAVAALSAAVVLALAGGFAGVLYELRIANEARIRAESQEDLANQRADELAEQQMRFRRELHRSDILRADLLMQKEEFGQAEQVLWRTYLTRPDDDDIRAHWRLWDLYRQRPRRSGKYIESTGISRSSSNSIARFSPDGRRLAVIHEPKVTVYDIATGAVICEITSSQTRILGAFFNGDASRLALLSIMDGSIAIWDVGPTPTLRTTIRSTAEPRPTPMMTLGGAIAKLPPEQMRDIANLAFFGQTRICFLVGDRLLVTNPDRATLWSLTSPTILAQCDLERRLNGAPNNFLGSWLTSAPEVAAGDTIAVTRGGVTELWDLPRTAGSAIVRTRLDFTDPERFHRITGANEVAKPNGRPEEMEGNLSLLSPDGKWLVTNHKRRLRVWDVASGAKLGEAQHDDAPNAVANYSLTPDGAALQSVENDKLRLWRLPRLESLPTISLLDPVIYGADAEGFSPDGNQTTIVKQNLIATYDHTPVETAHSLMPPDAKESLSKSWDLAATGPVIGSAPGFDGVALLHDGRMDKIKDSAGTFDTPIMHYTIAPTGATAVGTRAGVFSSSLVVCNLVDRKIAASFPLRDPENKSVRLIAEVRSISPDGRLVAILTGDGTLIVDVTTKKTVCRIGGGNNDAAMFTPDTRAVLYQTTPENKLVLVNVADGREIARSGSGLGNPLAFTADGTSLLTRGDRRLILLNAATLGEVGAMPSATNSLGKGDFSPDGRLFAAGSIDGKLRLWDMRRREELAAIDLGAGNIKKVVFTPDGNKVRFIAEKQIGELDLHAYDRFIEGNLTWNLMRLLPTLDKADAERVLERLRENHADAYEAGIKTLSRANPAKP